MRVRSRARRRRSDGAGLLPVGPLPIDTGTAEFVRDADRDTGWMLLVNGAESSHADLADPSWLEFEYLRWMAQVVEHRFGPAEPPDVLHLGAAGCSLARRLLATRPGSAHLAVEIDAALIALVRAWFELPRAPALRIRRGDARQVLHGLPDASRDVIVRDVFAGRTTPRELLTTDFVRQVRRVLRPGGLYLANCADGPDLAGARTDAAAIAEVFGMTGAIADPPMLKGRRMGNIVFLGVVGDIGGSEGLFADSGALRRALRGGAVPADLWEDARVRDFARSARPLRDPEPEETREKSGPFSRSDLD